MFVRIYCLVIVICLSAGLPIFAQSTSAIPDFQLTTRKIDEYMNAAVKSNHFSGSIIVAKDGQPIVDKGYGQANYELNIPNQPQTIFRIGSITKQFTATAIMQLQKVGKLNINDSICQYLAPCSQIWQLITIKNLLTHTSGIHDYTALPDFMKTASQPLSNSDLINQFKDKPLDFPVGEKYAYSNTGYNLLGIIIEKVSGQTYANYLQQNIFTPLGMKNTGYDESRKIIKNRAAGYLFDEKLQQNADFLDMSIPYSSGALYSTTGDLLIWDQALYTEKILPRNTLEEMFTPVKGGYGYGWRITEDTGHKEIYHGGGIFGFAARFSRFTDDKITIIVLSNNQLTAAGDIARDLTAIVFDKPIVSSTKR